MNATQEQKRTAVRMDLERRAARRAAADPCNVIRGDQVEQHDVRPAPWATAPGRQPISTTAQLLMDLLAAGTVARLDLLDAALEQARREGAAQALENAAGEVACWSGVQGLPEELQRRAALHRSGKL